ncbi:family 20 glycosylhydrolase [Gulosibacter chungangensis]|uniref:Family 20 glycosylhydrolase n=1 Tax=Gulosibacter chungangensis TaxID=979746 RepID=A0A7J5BF50_9MICO|nr:family 20 glycosylhydrolase [Gulosibacter chungangensis]KAB1644897.1 family 20 glycosylhydrolase [Gulosibacter chungangensis]
MTRGLLRLAALFALAGGVLLSNVILPASPTGAAAAPTPGPVEAEAAPLMMVPQPSQLPPADETPFTGSWTPESGTRILVGDASFATEASRLAEELAALGILLAEPEIFLLPEGGAAAAEVLAGDIVLEQGSNGPAILATPEGLTISGADSQEIFRATRPFLQQLVATESVPAGHFVFDLPAEQIRSVHIDIARKHYPIASLEALLFQLSWYGFNELELHFSENEGFAIESTTHPDIASEDAHSQAGISELIDLANSLHIRVAPSLDMPGHLDHALDTYPELRLRDPSGGEVFGALDITNPDALAFAQDLIGEYTELFSQPEFNAPVAWHLGGDEFVNFDSDYEVAALTASAQAEYGANATAYDALTAFVNDIAATVRDAGFQPRVFSDGMLRSDEVPLDPQIEVTYWTQRPPGAVPASEFAAAGYRLVNVNDEYLYFVLGERVGYDYPTGEAILAEWNDTVYPSVAGAPEIIEASTGGMLAIWSDIPDALDADSVVAAVRTPMAAMAVKFASPETTMPFSYLETMLDASDEPPAVRASDPGELDTLAGESTMPPTEPSGTDDPGGGVPMFESLLANQWLWWLGGALVGIAAIVATAAVRRRRG